MFRGYKNLIKPPTASELHTCHFDCKKPVLYIIYRLQNDIGLVAYSIQFRK